MNIKINKEELRRCCLDEAAFERAVALFDAALNASRKEHSSEEELLKKEIERHRKISAVTREGIFIHDKGTILEVNDSICRMLCCELEDIVGHSAFEFCPPEMHDIVRYHIAIGYELPYDILIQRKDGIVFPVEVQGTQITIEGKLLRITTVRDISKRKQTESDLMESEQRFRLLFESSPTGIIFVNIQGRFLDANPAFLSMLGYTLEEIKKKTFVDLTYPDDIEHSVPIFQNFAQGGNGKEYYNIEKRYIHKDGTPIWVHIVVGGLYNVSDDKKIIFGLYENIDARKKAEERQKLSEETFREMTNTISEAMYVQDEDGRFLDVNSAAEKMYGYKYEDFVGKTPEFLTAPNINNLPLVAECIQKAFNGEPQFFEFYGLKKDGTVFPKDVSVTPGIYFGKKVVIAVARDTTERKKAEMALRQSNKELSDFKLALNSSAIVFFTNVQGLITYANDQFYRSTGYSPEEIIGKNPRVLNSGYHPREFFTEMWHVIASGQIWRGEIKNKNKNGELFWTDLTIVPFLNEHGKPFQYVALRYEITKRKKAEEDLLQLNRTLEQRVDERTQELTELNKEKNNLLGIVAHDLKNPLSGIVLTASMVQNYFHKMQAIEVHEQMETIIRSSERMYNIITNLLDIHAIESNKINIHLQSYNLVEILESVAQEYGQRAFIKDIGITLGTPKEEVHVLADKSMLYEILENLVSNAVKYSYRSTNIRLTVEERW